MANYNKFDPRLESLVVETATHWSPDLAKRISDDDKKWLAEELHRNPRLATNIHYERTHTGFIRHITVTEEDIERLYRERVGA